MDVAELLRKEEGVQLLLYHDTRGIPTIGVGRNLRDRGITRAESDFMLENDIADHRAALAHFEWWRNLNEPRKAAIVSMRHQLGDSGLGKFQRMIAALAAGNFGVAADEALDSQAARHTPQRWRRNAFMLRTGSWPVW